MRRKLFWLLLFAFASVVHATPQDMVPTAAKHAVLDVGRYSSTRTTCQLKVSH